MLDTTKSFLPKHISQLLSAVSYESTKTALAKYVPSELMSYTLPHVVAFIGVEYAERDKLVGIFIFLAWIFWITHKSGQVILHPILVAFGWRLHEINFKYPGYDKEHSGTALIKGDVNTNIFVGRNLIEDVTIVK